MVAAFATVPREDFLVPGPWLVLADEAGYRSTPDADPRRLYDDIAVAIDASRVLNNGAPGFLARVFDELAIQPGETLVHIGCAVGYYSAILAESCPRGRVLAVELDPSSRRAAASAPLAQVDVRHGAARRSRRSR